MSKRLRPSTISGAILRRFEDPSIRRRLQPSVHVLDNSTTGIIFIKPVLEIFGCSMPAKHALEAFLQGSSRSRACECSGIALEDFDALLHLLLDKVEGRLERPVEEAAATNGRTLERLVLNVSQHCNLRCRYCYAAGGDYGLPRTLMSRDTALQTLDRFYGIFDVIKQIQFFGGEPLLNLDLVDFICTEIERRHQAGTVRGLPHFGIVTNGTLASSETLDILKAHDIHPTISLDGPKAITDYLRGDGVYDRVLAFVAALDERGIGYGFEATFTAFHLDSGVGLRELLDFFVTTFKKHEMHIPDAGLPAGHPLALAEHVAAKTYREGVEYSIRNLREGRAPWLSFATRLMDTFLDRKPVEHTCPAALGTISVDADGNAYPCFMFTGVERFRFGNVFDQVFPEPARTDRIVREILEADKSTDPRCSACWAYPFCFGCIGADFLKTGGEIRKTDCRLMKAMAEGFLCAAIDFLDGAPGQADSGRERHTTSAPSLVAC